MGPETKNARPSAIRFKRNWWRPVAALVLAASQATISETQSTPTVDPLSNRDYYQTQVPKEVIEANLQIDSVLHEFFSVQKLRQTTDQIIIQEINRLRTKFQEPQSSVNPNDQPENARIRALGYTGPTDPNPPPESQTSESVRILQVKKWLTEAGWPQELLDEAVSVVKCESSYIPTNVSPNGLYHGLFGLAKMWFEYAGEDFNLWANPILNAKAAYETYLYDIERKQPPWTQWDPACRPK